MPKLTIDGIAVEVPAGTTILQAAESIGIEIPRFCYHERLSIAGNCRMCLVEVKPGPPKPAASCAMPVAEGMEVRTDSEMARKARRGVMEFLLINHPLDCPICDQGGECDLQDQAMTFGSDHSRYLEPKRAVTEKYLGPLIKTAMTRCIHCTRCVRFATEVAGVPELGMVGRGEHAEITSYLESAIASELSGNVVDLCPVGALTSAPYAFLARPWELRKTESIDVLDAVGSNIRIDTRSGQVMRVLPRLNEAVNEEWLADKSRHAVDGLRYQRLDTPYVRRDGKLVAARWDEAFAAIAERLAGVDGGRIAALAGDQADVEAMTALKDLMAALGSPHLDCRQDGAKLDPTARAGYLFNTTIAGIESADALLIIGSDIRWEAPIINARIRKRSLMGGFPVGRIGAPRDLTYPVTELGEDLGVLTGLIEGGHAFAQRLKDAKRPMVIVGQGALTGADGAAVLAAARALAEAVGAVDGEGWNGFNVLHTAAARVGGLDLGFVPGAGGRDTAAILEGCGSGAIEVLYLLGADEIDTTALGKAFVIYQGHHGDAGAQRADVILPGSAYTEKDATYVNTEGRVQRTRRAVFPPGEAKEDWAIVRALSAVLGKTLPFDSLEAVRARMNALNPLFARPGEVKPAPWTAFGAPGALGGGVSRSPIANYYMTCPISRASPTMAECTRVFLNGSLKRTGTDG
ncbi:NADH-quinone oxidoreductase subunit NuoG [Rhodospirillum rubrum]|uniref:NADH-quinone oxidoreductase n=1 Tax=Rhodospirillum rubrum (strain ATCC 11170 / ATH 1.1.1 / DSM 467 / LMG 4362 / NCIMB 8255 / S1) TaxID=269796 RepID=Q2RU34_RHORT|nr:NADH-quinone oxidoreductase subunit NuoG [Rhodospirillum rubrum]ABC22361.1 NADH-quinone oxidoreductase, chain G [Rhodospirillum rubrum ATCC 11170]MBK5953941.1 NADH-quinone oxidoreductase subunit G [Rhodospirillum rubrum]QXG82000.1 NADH-quinone oxidoreductase subunit NuoG [Rhodospirillum rubrum]HAQ01250.1 NADH-quinone oxidoreductase subunit G [Rhodospirillum rubrum]HCF18429.1 NADH-quinone oxidoreductase subunit G [Rhodospirillum rubrum]